MELTIEKTYPDDLGWLGFFEVFCPLQTASYRTFLFHE